MGILGSVPNPEPNNWEYPAQDPYNSYRRNAQGDAGDAFCAPDLQVYDLKTDFMACPNLKMTVWVTNKGCLGVGPGVKVSFYEEQAGYLGTVTTKNPLTPGASEQVAFEAMNNVEPANIWAVVDDDGMMKGALNECKEDNNKVGPIAVCNDPK